MRRTTLVAVGLSLALMAGACADPEQEPTGAPAAGFTADGVVPLAKVEGWRPGLGSAGDPFAVLEIAFDRQTAERAWQDNVPANLRPAEAVPGSPGRYGDLGQVNFDRQAVVVWSSGESGSCPGWLAGIRTHADGRVEVERRDTSSEAEETDGEVIIACTMDYRPYRMVLAVDRDLLPAADDLPISEVEGLPDGLVTTYPAG